MSLEEGRPLEEENLAEEAWSKVRALLVVVGRRRPKRWLPSIPQSIEKTLCPLAAQAHHPPFGRFANCWQVGRLEYLAVVQLLRHVWVVEWLEPAAAVPCCRSGICLDLAPKHRIMCTRRVGRRIGRPALEFQ